MLKIMGVAQSVKSLSVCDSKMNLAGLLAGYPRLLRICTPVRTQGPTEEMERTMYWPAKSRLHQDGP